MRQKLIGFALVALALLVFTFAFIIPLDRVTGVIEATRDNCTGLPKATRNYHILLGQKHDYDLVAPHVVPPTSDCGQRAEFSLYL